MLNEPDIHPFTILDDDLEVDEATLSFLVLDEYREEDIHIEI